MERMKTTNSLGTKELVLLSALLAVMGGCADNIEECLGDRGEGKKDKIADLVKDCDDYVDEYFDDPDSHSFNNASSACSTASVRSAQLFGDLRGERRLNRRRTDKYGSCTKAMKWAKARNAEANADGIRLHGDQL